MSTLTQIANWNSLRNPLEHVAGRNGIAPTIVARDQASDNAMMILVSEDFDDESKDLRGLYMTKNNNVKNEFDDIPIPFDEPIIAASRGRKDDTNPDSPYIQKLEFGDGEASNTLTTAVKDNLVVEPINPNEINLGVEASGERLTELNYRIRKLTEKECFRLMGVKDEDFEHVATHQSMSSLYHLAGDSIVVDVLKAIFNELLPEDKSNLM